MSVRKPYGVRQFNPPLYVRIVKGSDEQLDVTFPVFELTGFEVRSDTFDITFPVFELSDFEIRSDTFDVTFPVFDVEFTSLSGAATTLDVTFPPFEVSFTAQTGTVFDIEFPSFTVDFKNEPYAEIAFDIEFPVFVPEFYSHGGAGTEYAAWVVNARTGLHSLLTNFDCTGIVNFNNKWYGLFDDGIYELTGDKDGTTDIDARVTWAPTNFGSPKQKRVDYAFIKARRKTSGTLKLIVTADEQQKRIYTVTVTGQAGMARHRQKLAKGLEGELWQFSIENVNGGDLTIAELEVPADILNRAFK